MTATERRKVQAIIVRLADQGPVLWGTIRDTIIAEGVEVKNWFDVRNILQSLIELGWLVRTNSTAIEQYRRQ